MLGRKRPYILIDTGEGKPAYLPLLRQALTQPSEDSQQQGPAISDILLSHWHHDHTAGLPHVLDLLKSLSPTAPLPRIHKFPCADKDERLHASDTYHALTTSQRFPLSSSNESLEILATPGHTTDSASYLLRDLSSNHITAIFTADTVLGQGTCVFEDLTAYMGSLDRLLAAIESETNDDVTVFPGHGPARSNGKEWIEGYREHRLERERSIVAALRASKEPVDLLTCVTPCLCCCILMLMSTGM